MKRRVDNLVRALHVAFYSGGVQGVNNERFCMNLAAESPLDKPAVVLYYESDIRTV